MKVLITGASGQLGRELRRAAPPGVAVDAVDRAELDITAAGAAQAIVTRAPAVVINAAAYTAVDGAESDAARAHAVNAGGAEAVARAARALGARLIHVSTDFVFDGTASRPYPPDAPAAPLGVYGASKHAGEVRVRECGGDNSVIVRTAWVYSAFGANFVKTMLRLMRERDSLGVVSDQVGTPTWARGLSAALWELAARPDIRGVLHWTDLGVASWYDFALAIQELALARGMLARAVPVNPIRTVDYPTPAKRPAFSVLDTSRALAELRCDRLHWRAALARMLDDLQQMESPTS
jgi:dTDP-4-dehydrorhamnose reductase